MTSIEDTLESYEGLIRYIAKSAIMSSNVIDIDDLVQVGTMAAAAAIKSYDSAYGASLRTHLSKIVRRAIFDEAARFIGPMTVADYVITSLAAEVSKMADKGMADSAIASSLSRKRLRWECTVEYVTSLRLLYQRRHTVESSYEISTNDYSTEDAIMLLLSQLETTDLEHSIIYDHWLGNLSKEEIMKKNKASRRQFFKTQKDLKCRLYELLQDYQ